MLWLGPNTGFGFPILSVSWSSGSLLSKVMCLPGVTWQRACHAELGIGAFVDVLITGIAIRVHFLPVQQVVAFEHIVNIAGCAAHCVNQTRVCVCVNVGRHAKVPLMLNFCLVKAGSGLTVFGNR